MDMIAPSFLIGSSSNLQVTGQAFNLGSVVIRARSDFSLQLLALDC